MAFKTKLLLKKPSINNKRFDNYQSFRTAVYTNSDAQIVILLTRDKLEDHSDLGKRKIFFLLRITIINLLSPKTLYLRGTPWAQC
jgi:hypothetical protein